MVDERAQAGCSCLDRRSDLDFKWSHVELNIVESPDLRKRLSWIKYRFSRRFCVTACDCGACISRRTWGILGDWRRGSAPGQTWILGEGPHRPRRRDGDFWRIVLDGRISVL